MNDSGGHPVQSDAAPKAAPAGNPLRHGVVGGNPWSAPRCGARTKRTGKPCMAPAVRGRARCRMHGAFSTGARTAQGLARLTRHGAYGREMAELFVEMKRLRAEAAELVSRVVESRRKRAAETAPAGEWE